MKNKTIAFLSALVLCISAFVLPTTVFAASSDDTTPRNAYETMRLFVND